MRSTTTAFVILVGVSVTGCVSPAMHNRALADLEQARQQAAEAQESAELEKQGTAERLATLERENARLGNDLLEAQSSLGRARTDVARVQEELASEQEARRGLGEKLIKVQSESRQVDQLSGELRRERDQIGRAHV